MPKKTNNNLIIILVIIFIIFIKRFGSEIQAIENWDELGCASSADGTDCYCCDITPYYHLTTRYDFCGKVIVATVGISPNDACGTFINCSDTDMTNKYPDGRNMYQKGRVTDKNGNVSNYDYCIDSNTLFEFYCTIDPEGYSVTEYIDCLPGYECNDGTCKSVTCMDTDMTNTYPQGRNIYSVGRTTNMDGIISEYDTCSDINTVYEHYCLSDGNSATEYIDCPDGSFCENGICNQQNCMPNTMWCEFPNIWQCSSDGVSKSIVDICEENEICEKVSSIYVRCASSDVYYCKSNDHLCYEYSENSYPEHCYTTLQLCQNEQCDFDGICEYSMGETNENCPTDCRDICGNGIIEFGEDCDGSNLNSKTCILLGYDSGTLSCNNCDFDTSACIGEIKCSSDSDCEFYQKCMNGKCELNITIFILVGFGIFVMVMLRKKW
jgi:hypothetical protein